MACYNQMPPIRPVEDRPSPPGGGAGWAEIGRNGSLTFDIGIHCETCGTPLIWVIGVADNSF